MLFGKRNTSEAPAANDNQDLEAERTERLQAEGERQQETWSVLRNIVSDDVWMLLGQLSLAESFEDFGKGVDWLNTVTRTERGAPVDTNAEPQMIGVLNFTRQWKLRVSRYPDGGIRYEALP